MSKSVLQDVEQKVYAKVRVVIQYRDTVLSGIPKNADMLDFFVKKKQMSEAEIADFRARVEKGEMTEEEKATIKNTAWCQFEIDHDGDLVLWHGNVKAMLREIFTTIGLTQKKYKKGSKEAEGHAGGKQVMQHAVHVDPLRIKLLIDGKPVQEPTGYVDRIKHIEDMNGKRSALGRHDYLKGATAEFFLKWPKNSCFDVDDMKKALAFAQDDGLGSSRSQGFGKFDVIAFDVIAK